jgi:prepilin signal peptidase PulO-like enzyme (type II secretory pathway)
MVGLFCLGALVGGQINRGIYRLAWYPRAIGPWSKPPEDAPKRRWFDRIPIYGWVGLSREAKIHGRGFWIRPLLIELAVGVGYAALYWYEVHQIGVYSVAGVIIPPFFAATLKAQLIAHLVLFSLMIVATFIDFDEQTIPDSITIPGVLAGLIFAAVRPESLPLVTNALPPFSWETLTVTSPNPWPGWMDGQGGLAVGLLCFWAACFAVIPWTWTTRRGWSKACEFLVASIRRHPVSGRIGILAVVGAIAITSVWMLGNPCWKGLLTSLIGMAFGGGLIWAVRIIGRQALGQEAMGFGDVTLMSMIGAFTGWQATLAIFFLAPVAALFISVTQWILTRRRDIAFGPYLCLATLYLSLRWGPIWHQSAHIFAMGWVIPAMVVCCLALMWAMLTILRFIRMAFTGAAE